MAGASSALIEMGGNAQGQTIRDSHVYEPRGWSCLHGIGKLFYHAEDALRAFIRRHCDFLLIFCNPFL